MGELLESLPPSGDSKYRGAKGEAFSPMMHTGWPPARPQEHPACVPPQELPRLLRGAGLHGLASGRPELCSVALYPFIVYLTFILQCDNIEKSRLNDVPSQP